MRGSHCLSHVCTGGYELGMPKPASSEIETSVCHHKKLPWARNFQLISKNLFPVNCSSRLCSTMSIYLLVEGIDMVVASTNSSPPSLDGRLRERGGLSDPLNLADCSIASESSTRGHVHRLTDQSRPPSAERARSFWEGSLALDLHLCQGSPYGLSDQPCERQTRAPIYGIAQTIYEITGKADR